jgi:prevent-host-death family protein
MTVEHASVSARDLSRRTAVVLDRVEHGERLTITRDGEPIAEIIPLDRARRMLARWIKDGLISPPPTSGYAKAGDVSNAVRRLPADPPGPTASETLLRMRKEERY